MDLLSHALMGGLVASVCLQKKYGLAASATMVAASVIPDLDSALTVLGPRYFLQYHRHPLTHSIGGTVLLSAALTIVVSLATPLKRPWLVFAISLGGMLLHLVSDLFTPWPIPLFFPISARSYSLDLINFLDPFLLVVLGASFLAVRRWPERGALLSLLTLLVVVSYLGFRVYGQQTAIRLVRERASTSKITALPHRISLATWDVITQEDSGYTYYVVDSLRKMVRSSQVFRTTNDERAATASGKSALVQAFLKRARFPFTIVTEEEGLLTVEWLDVHLINSGGALRGVKIVLNGRGDIVEERFELNS